jgi:REP element-mobilizing transposase RayT
VPRKLRVNVEGGIYHVYARGNARGLIYADDVDRRVYLRELDRCVSRFGWSCLAYCLMGNHVHLMIETPAPNLSSGMQLLHGRYAQRFNFRHERSGHLFQGRYGAVLMRREGQVQTTAAYIAKNPVAAGLCKEPADWPWSSFRGIAIRSLRPSIVDIDRLLLHFSSDHDEAIRRYVALATAPPPAF